MSKKRVLCVGLVCLDIISHCDGFPEEDSDVRCLEQRLERGGNASNMATVLSLLGSEPVYAGTIANSFGKSFILEDFLKYGINTKAVFCDGYSCPMSVVLLNVQSGSRTIVHSNRNLPEYTVEDFAKIDLAIGDYTWIHFEGRRSVSDILQMLQMIDTFNSENSSRKIRTSLEIEKKLPVLDKLHGVADVTFISKDYAQYHGKNTKEEAVTYFVQKCKPGAAVVCPWGEDGAAAMVNCPSDAGPWTVAAHSPPEVVDTLAAGDTFIAACIHAMVCDKDLETALRFGCHVAGEKCGVKGLEELRHRPLSL